MKKFLISLAATGILIGGGVPAAYAQDDSSSSTSVSQPADSSTQAQPDINVKVEAPAPAAAPPVQIIDHSVPSTHTQTSSTTKETTKVVEQAAPATAPDSNVGLFLILGGLGLVTVLALFVGAQSTSSTTTVRETYVH